MSATLYIFGAFIAAYGMGLIVWQLASWAEPEQARKTWPDLDRADWGSIGEMLLGLALLVIGITMCGLSRG